MAASGKRDALHLGFLTALDLQEQGYVGGLLLTNHQGRPLEFQCTTPVKANRTQEILYGPTLVPFLLTELIGRTLVERVGVKPHLLLTEQWSMLDLRTLINLPLAYLAETDQPPTHLSDEHPQLLWKPQTLVFHLDYTDDVKTAEGFQKRMPKEVNLQEPFERVREALNETLNVKAA